MKIAITGNLGFVGKHLEDYLISPNGEFTEGYTEVVGFDSKKGQDLLDYEQVRTWLDLQRPTHIYHLAAQAYVPESFINPRRAFEVNTMGSLNLLEAVRQLGLKTRILLAGTSEEYGNGGPNEEDPPNPLSPYAISKLAMDHIGRLYAKSYGMNVVVTRAFNHTGPGRGEQYAESAFAKQIVEIENGTRQVLKHGNLESIRNYTDVRDTVQAYVQAIELPSDVYNICSDQNVSMDEVLAMLCNSSDTDIQTEVDPNLYRPSDFSFKKPSCKKFTKLTDWKPEIKLEQTLSDLLNYWRIRL